jgi:quercetin dioxygenase-like cupin family protein
MDTSKVDQRSQPVDLTNQAAALFSLPALMLSLSEEANPNDSNRNALTLLRNEELTAVLTVVKEGAECGQHSAPSPAMIIALSGEVEIRAADGASIYVPQGLAAALAPGVPHQIAAVTDCAYLLVIGGQHGEEESESDEPAAERALL